MPVQVLCNSHFTVTRFIPAKSWRQKWSNQRDTFGNCCFPEHPKKNCHANIGCITQTVNKTLEYVSTPPQPNQVKIDVMALPSVGEKWVEHDLQGHTTPATIIQLPLAVPALSNRTCSSGPSVAPPTGKKHYNSSGLGLKCHWRPSTGKGSYTFL